MPTVISVYFFSSSRRFSLSVRRTTTKNIWNSIRHLLIGISTVRLCVFSIELSRPNFWCIPVQKESSNGYINLLCHHKMICFFFILLFSQYVCCFYVKKFVNSQNDNNKNNSTHTKNSICIFSLWSPTENKDCNIHLIRLNGKLVFCCQRENPCIFAVVCVSMSIWKIVLFGFALSRIGRRIAKVCNFDLFLR